MLAVCYINKQPGKGYYISDTNACGESAASKKKTKISSGSANRICAVLLGFSFFFYQNIEWQTEDKESLFNVFAVD